MGKCPVCGADTRPDDNYCLNCGQRLLPNTPSPSPVQQAQPSTSNAAQDYQGQGIMGTIPAGPAWSEANASAPTVAAAPPELPTLREAGPAPTAQATLDRIEQPARFVLRADSGETLQEYHLDKVEMVVGRAPNSDILLSKDKLTSRRHATVRYENNQYYLYDDHSANGTFVNGQQIEDTIPYLLRDGDQVGIGEHELVFYAYQSPAENIEDLPTRAVPFGVPQQEATYRTRDDSLATIPSSDDYGTRSMDEQKDKEEPIVSSPVANATEIPVEEQAASQPAQPIVDQTFYVPPTTTTPDPVESPVQEQSKSQPDTSTQAPPSSPALPDTNGNITFSRLTNLPQPALPDMSALMAALSSLDGQIMFLQEQFNTTQESMRNRDAELARNANELRAGIRRVSDRMDNTIADVARSREALAWAELLQLMEDVMNNPRDVEYITKLARKARELNKVFQIHQNVLNTMAECNSLLRSMIGEDNS
jgi:pSer/pThr/pTyr-binding forkhead associated (FHA) protein